MELLGFLVFPAFVAGWIGGRVDWNSERRYWKDRAQRRNPPVLVVTAIPLGAESAHVVIDATDRPVLAGRETA